ncbi:DUF378 domain-containing protein [Thiotrichales bacterium 19S9-12]|nr:DUF378 domain-containing protein [Thiotrichales bacterium 19S9-11]MCF6811502.1 DUF378 domain-containing protein [Thiotrichales bacterium 19S9-12]
MKLINFLALLLIVIGGINWLLVGLFKLNLVVAIFGGLPWLVTLIYILVGVSAIYAISFFKKVSK